MLWLSYLKIFNSKSRRISPKFSSRSFKVLALTFKSVIQVEFIFCVRQRSVFVCQINNYPRIICWTLSFLHWIAFRSLSKIKWHKPKGFRLWIVPLSICLFLYQYQTVLITVVYSYNSSHCYFKILTCYSRPFAFPCTSYDHFINFY